jgi:hypothetical protein
MIDPRLTFKEEQHLRDVGVRSRAGLLRNAEEHAKWRRRKPYVEPCWVCKLISRKLGLPV